MSPTKASTTAVTEQDKIAEARRKDVESNLKGTTDRADQTAAHELLPSDVEGFARQHELTVQEAGEALHGRSVDQATKEVDAIKAGRSVNRQVYVQTPAGTSSPFADNRVAVPPPPPDPSALDPHAPGPHDPTGYVAGKEEDRSEEAKRLAGGYVEAADELTEQVDAQGDEASKEDTTDIPTE